MHKLIHLELHLGRIQKARAEDFEQLVFLKTPSAVLDKIIQFVTQREYIPSLTGAQDMSQCCRWGFKEDQLLEVLISRFLDTA
ncbi:hypothetical protein Zmor_014513 [Zophobas morio]|uniref:Uncharacterized protein n=1 Tax=Zophobas morio TaxID=2755281 RepID=A0AA38IF93_9CUCU|nr:hypothetical protein Zmor_014513 [Zophobas morio]